MLKEFDVKYKSSHNGVTVDVVVVGHTRKQAEGNFKRQYAGQYSGILAIDERVEHVSIEIDGEEFHITEEPKDGRSKYMRSNVGKVSPKKAAMLSGVDDDSETDKD